MRAATSFAAVGLAIAGFAVAPLLRAQSVASRVTAVRDGVVLLTFAARPGVCATSDGLGWNMSQRNDGRACVPGPVRVSVGRSENTTISIRTRVGGAWRAAGSETDLGVVSAPEAARYLVSLASGIAGRSSGEALAAASIADSVDVAPELTRLVHSGDAPIESRKDALFWLGQTDLPTASLAGIYDGLEPAALREQFTFVISQRREDAAVDKLIDIARHDSNHDIRKQAMYWLGQSKNPKAYTFLRDILTR